MKRLYISALLFITCFGQLNAWFTVQDALSYTPINSGKTDAIIYGSGAVAALLSFWAIHEVNNAVDPKKQYTKKKNMLQEACNIVLSPFKAIGQGLGICKNPDYPSLGSYLGVVIAGGLGYLASKFAFSFTPEGKFCSAQNAIANIAYNETFQKLTEKKSWLDYFKTKKEALFYNIWSVFATKNHPHVKAHDFFSYTSDSITSALKSLPGARTIEDAKARKLIPVLEKIARNQQETCKSSIWHIVTDPTWSTKIASYLNQKAQEEQIKLQREMLWEQKKLREAMLEMVDQKK